MAEELVILRNRNRYKPFAFTLYHAYTCQDGKCYCGQQAKMGRDERGEFSRAEQSVFIAPRGQSKPLPAVVLKIPQVKCALAEPNFLEVANALSEVQVFTAPAKPVPLPPPAPAQVFTAPSRPATATAAPVFTKPSSKGPRGR